MLTDEEILAQVLAAFQEEQAEHRETATQILLELEREPDHPKYQELLNQLFREAHSLKGGARAAGQGEVELIAHRIEDLFSAVRRGKLQLTPDVCDAIYGGFDAIGAMMGQVAAGQKPDLTRHQHVLDALTQILSRSGETAGTSVSPDPSATAGTSVSPDPSATAGTSVSPDPSATAETSPPRVPSTFPESVVSDSSSFSSSASPMRHEQGKEHRPQGEDSELMVSPHGGGHMPWESVTTVRLSIATLDSLLNETGELITCAVRAQQRSREAHLIAEIPMRWRRTWRQIRSIVDRLQGSLPSSRPMVHHLGGWERWVCPAEPWSAASTEDLEGEWPTIAAQLPMILDSLKLANELFGELEWQLSHHVRHMSDDYARLSVVTDRLHEQVRRTRMLPIATILNPLRVQVREIARAAGKSIELHLEDGGVEADRQVLERLREVLLHVLRNAVDHGIEPATIRVARGKPANGRIVLRAEVRGDYLTVSVEDDGAGLDFDAIRQRALASGLMSRTDLERASEAELTDLIFLAGFSTCKTVSKVSGRGVGLDVVHSQIERMHGRIAVHSVQGQGCIFTISVPLSLTSAHGLLLRVDQATYMIPLDAVQRIVSVAPGEIQFLEGRSCLIVDHRPLTLMHLTDIIGHVERLAGSTERHPGYRTITDERTKGGRNRTFALLLGSGERQIACTVDEILGEQELVVYRLPVPLQRVRFVAGATILADGSVVPILDVVDMVRAAIGAARTPAVPTKQLDTRESHQRKATILVVDDSITTRTLEKNILEAAGYTVKLATDGVEALEVLRQLMDDGGCDLLLSDIDMPRLNGFELTSMVRSDPNLKHIPIVLVTSLDSPTDRERGITAGADAYIVKRAFDQQLLLDTIEQLTS